MMKEYSVLVLLGIPLLGFVLTFFIPKTKEYTIATIVKLVTGTNFIVALLFFISWLLTGAKTVRLKQVSVLKSGTYNFYLDFMADRLSMVYLLFGTLLLFLIAIFSQRYLHREEGYKRFFSVFQFFAFGYLLILFSGNFETMFTGWEILGVSSFLLIAFYRTRYLPVKNAVKVFSIYRIGDVGLILAMWLSHHLWGHNIAFSELSNVKSLHDTLINHSTDAFLIGGFILLTASVKSALFPFSSWLPRAMEGPTPSSAIFYGSLSVHIGAFLLIRTTPYWEDQVSVRIMIATIGLITLILANFSARVQSSIKSQIGYASIAQIGIIFIEIAVGFETIALIHISANAFYRSFQLLISPSSVTYKIREQFYHFEPKHQTIEDSLPTKIAHTFYSLALREWNLDSNMYRYLWIPLKKMGNGLNFLSIRRIAYFIVPVFAIGLVLLATHAHLPIWLLKFVPIIFAFIGLLMVLKSFTERRNVMTSWFLVIFNQAFVVLAIAYNEHLSTLELITFSSGTLVAGAIGFSCLWRLKKIEKNVSMNQFQGHVYEHPKITLVFLIACLGVAGFPITPTFIGEDLLFSHINEDQFLLAGLAALSFVIDGIALIRIYSRIFLGPHVKNYHEVAKRSS